MNIFADLELKIPPLLLMAITGVLMWFSTKLAPILMIAIPGRQIMTVIFAAVGTALCTLGIASFRRHKTTVDPMKPRKASSLVTNGIYRYTRNPMYLGFVFLLLGWAIWLSHLLPFAFVLTFMAYMVRFQIRSEEQALEDCFGKEYRDYRAQVRRWL